MSVDCCVAMEPLVLSDMSLRICVDLFEDYGLSFFIFGDSNGSSRIGDTRGFATESRLSDVTLADIGLSFRFT